MNTPEKTVYTAVADNKGGRDGQAHTENPEMTLDVRPPKEMGGDGAGTNPEQLFAMGYGACFQGAMSLAAKELDVNVDDSAVRAHVSIGPEGDSFAISVKIEVYIPGMSVDEMQKVADRTHELCPYSKATRGNVPVEVVAVPAL